MSTEKPRFLSLQNLNLAGKRVLIREDLNVPIHDGVIGSDLRLQAALPTIRLALDAGAAVIVMSHLGRPKEGALTTEDSMQPVADWFTHALGQKVSLHHGELSAVSVQPGSVVMLENVRGNVGEKSDDAALAARYAALCDIFVMDAFGTAHRAEASTHGVGLKAKVACAGPLLARELDALQRGLSNPARPLLAIVGGSKVSTKLEALKHLVERVDQLIIGGGMANTFLAASGYAVGKSLCEHDMLAAARDVQAAARSRGTPIPLPTDVVVASAFAADAMHRICGVNDIKGDEMILDIGPETSAEYRTLALAAKTIVWNGPVGVFEFPAFAAGTRALTEAIAESAAFSVAGGGDTLAAIDQFGATANIGYISTGGGAFLEFLEGKTLPAVAMLESRAKG